MKRPNGPRRGLALASALTLAASLGAGAAESPAAAGLPAEATALPSAPAAAAAPARAEPPRRAIPPEAVWGPEGAPVRAHAGEADYGMPMPWGEASFEAFRASYLSPGGREWLAAVLGRAAPYLPYVHERIRLYGLPEELAFLPVIESEYSAKAVSRSGAAGLWQFMRNSIAGYGMRVDDWVDERRDFMKSSDGALRKLADNYAVLGDWQLALAAYNAGLGALGRAVAKAKAEGVEAPDFWELRRRGLLRKETASYVPKFLAVASILRHPGRHGLPPSWSPGPAWETIEPGRQVDIALLAQKAGLRADALKSANAELRYSVTPPARDYRLKVPAETAPALREVLADPAAPLVRYAVHTVRSGDTVSAISRRYGSPQSAILQANPGLRPDFIKLGQKLVVPLLGEPAPQAAAGREEAEAAPDFSGTYAVAKGDTLWALSLRFEVQPELLAERNGLGLDSVLREGMTLRVPIPRETP